MLVAQNSLGPVCPVPLTVRGIDSDDELPPLDKNLSVADQSHIDDLFDLLESRCREANIPPRFQIKLLV